jgi:DNA-directed RNA polymerase specialized sigma24 family protein
MLEPTPRIEEDEFRSVTAELVARAERGAGRIRAVPKAEAEDVVQDAWEREIRKNKKRKRSFPQGDQLVAHMSATVADTAVEHRRRWLRKKEIPPTQRVSLEVVSDAAAAVVGGDVEEEVLARMAADQISEALSETVDPDVQRLAVLSALDYTESEAGSALGLSAHEMDAARHRLKRRRLPLAQKIDKTLSERREDD